MLAIVAAGEFGQHNLDVWEQRLACRPAHVASNEECSIESLDVSALPMCQLTVEVEPCPCSELHQLRDGEMLVVGTALVKLY